MAVNGFAPFVKVLDSNGVPIVGAVLHVYEVGTTTNRAIWSDTALSVALSNPLTGVNASNASGDFPRFYMSAGVYKLRAETSTGTLIWEWDNIDTGVATGGTVPIASGGTGSTTAAAALTALGAAATSDVTALATQISTLTASLQNIISQPQGRLTLTSNTPVLATGVSAATSVFYTPYIGALCPVFDGVQFNVKTFAEQTLTLNSNYVLNSHYDCFIINDAGNGITLVTGPAWTTITAGSGARGAGAGTTELVRQSGLYVNANAMATARNGSSTFSVAAKCGTYIGSLYIDGTAGQVSCLLATGQSRKWGVWNAYNRVLTTVSAQDPTASWTTAPTTWRQSRGDATNFITVFQGLPLERVDIVFTQAIQQAFSSNISAANIGIGVNSTTVPSGKLGFATASNTTTAGTFIMDMKASNTLLPFIGINALNMLEQAPTGTTNNNFEGGNDMLMTASWAT